MPELPEPPPLHPALLDGRLVHDHIWGLWEAIAILNRAIDELREAGCRLDRLESAERTMRVLSETMQVTSRVMKGEQADG